MLHAAGKWFASLLGPPTPTGGSFHPSQTCPDCGSKLFREIGPESAWLCPNLDCPAQIRARLEHWCSPAAMNIPGGDAALIAKLVGHGLVRDVAELYRLKVNELAALEGATRESAGQFFEAIQASRRREGWRVLYGLAIPQVAAAEAQLLCRHFGSVDNVFAASGDRLMQAAGVGAEAACGIDQWHSDGVNRRLVRRLFKAGLNFKCLP
jgi:DNA ligase (NAD+)